MTTSAARARARARRDERRSRGDTSFEVTPEVTAKLGDYTVLVSGCWSWNGSVNPDGYGRVFVDGISYPAPAASYEVHVGPYNHELEIDHLCHGWDTSCAGGGTCVHRRCVNPSHLEPVSRRVNVHRGRSFAAANAAKLRCERGHPFDEVNTRIVLSEYGPTRECKACKRQLATKRARERYASDPEYRERIRQQSAVRRADPAVRERERQQSAVRRADPEYRERERQYDRKRYAAKRSLIRSRTTQ